ncbi:MAG: hypothetical protein AAGG59_01335 [Bacteroidota bacterium]
MRIYIVFFSSVVVLGACKSSLYRFTTTKSYSAKELTSTQKYILLDSSHFRNQVSIDVLSEILNKNRLEKEYTTLNLTKAEYNFLTAVLLMRDEEFSKASILLDEVDDTLFDCQSLVLKIDCSYELGMNKNPTAKYQKAHDCSNNKLVKKITRDRFRYFKHGY